MNRDFTTPTVSQHWCDTHGTHMAVAVAIHAISDSRRSAEQIWEAPTPTEWEHVTMAVQEYVTHGDFEPEPDGYKWGLETVLHFS